MNKENNVVYVKTKKGIFKCYKSEQMGKPIYYLIESKTNGFIDYNEVMSILSNDDLYNELKKQKDNWNKLKEYLENKIDEYSINLEYLSTERMIQIKNKMQELEKGSDNNE